VFFFVVVGGTSHVDYAADPLAELHRKLAEYFSDEELETLCFDLGIDYADLPADGKAFKARDLVGVMERRGRIPELTAAAAKQRPNVSWDMLGQNQASAPAAPLSSGAQGLLRKLMGRDGQPGSRTGDVIMAEVGAGAKNVAVGKNVAQANVDVSGRPASDDAQVIEHHFKRLAEALDQARGQVDASAMAVADFQMKLLRGELGKTKENDVPSATAILQVGDWLLTNLPQIKPALTALFTAPAVSRVMAKAGSDAVSWTKAKFG
jgi:hypothetical protein